MPRENKKRGRREDQRERKRKNPDFPTGTNTKRANIHGQPTYHTQLDDGFAVSGDDGADFISFGYPSKPDSAPDNWASKPSREETSVFFGLLTEEEQDYYANVNAKLDANDFPTLENRNDFIDAVYRETRGKELKIACSQSSSRYLEKLVALSTPSQVAELFRSFQNHLTALVCHRFASHVVESLLVKSEEILDAAGNDERKLIEDVLLKAAEELKPNIGYLLTEKFASHSIRMMLLIFSGESLHSEFSRSIFRGGKKSATNMNNVAANQQIQHHPETFELALSEFITTAVSGLEAAYLRALATHPVGSPVLRLLLRLELTALKTEKKTDKGSLLRRFLPDDSFESGSENEKFIRGLIYDPTGSHLVESLVQYAPGKLFKKIYRNIIQPRLTDFAKNDLANYVATRALERLGKDDLQAAVAQISPDILMLISQNRLGVVKTILERCTVRKADPEPIIDSLCVAYGKDPSGRLLKMLKLDSDADVPSSKPAKQDQASEAKPTQAVDSHGSVLAQCILRTPESCNLLHESILRLPNSLLMFLAQDQIASPVIQAALLSPCSPQGFLRQLTHKFQNHLLQLAQSPVASHVVDALWTATTLAGAHFMKENFAAELAAGESMLRESPYGRAVWRNWSMDLYLRRPKEWRVLAKNERHDGGTKEIVTTEAKDDENTSANVKKPIDKARARFFARKTGGHVR